MLMGLPMVPEMTDVMHDGLDPEWLLEEEG